jgi:hypothetical protein
MIGRIFPVVILLIAAGIFFSYVHPTYTEDIAKLRTTIQGYDKALSAAKIFGEKQAALLAEQNAISEEDRSRVESFLPDGVDNVQLIVDLNALASRSGLRLSNFDVDAPQEDEPTDSSSAGRLAVEGEGPTESLDVTVNAVGTYPAFRSFLDNAEWSLRPMDLVSLTVGDSETGVYTYQMTFRIYWLR